MAETNFFLVNRSILNHWIWNDKPFSKGQAWIDLIALANHTDKKTECRGQIVTCKRGDVNLSMLALSKRWGWTRGRTERFLKLLEFDGMLKINATTNRTTLTIENYSKYQDLRATHDTTDEQQTSNGQTTDEQRTDITKEGKRRLKKVNNNIPPSVEEVREYCKSRKNNVNPETFIDFYSSKGWYVGKNKMKDWRAAVRNWERSGGTSKSKEEVKPKKYAEYKPDEKEPEKISDAEQAARVRQMRERLGGCFEKI